MPWYENFDYYENPFSTKPEEGYELVGFDDIIEDVLYRIESGSMMFIEGKEGSGKSSLLRLAIKKYGGKKRIIYFDCSKIDKKLNIADLMKGRYGLVGRLLNKIPTDMILLLDNVNELSAKNANIAKYYFDQGYVHSIIFTGENYDQSKLPESIKERIGSRVTKLRPLTDYEAVEVVRKRFEEEDFLADEIIKKIYKSSKKNIKLLLENCDKVCAYAIKCKAKAVTKEHVKKVLRR